MTHSIEQPNPSPHATCHLPPYFLPIWSLMYLAAPYGGWSMRFDAVLR